MAHETLSDVTSLLDEGIAQRIYPGAVLLAARRGDVRIFQAVGKRTLVPDPLPMSRETLFDLASLTKPLATTLAMMKLVNEDRIGLDAPLEALIPHGIPEDRRGITPRLLLTHSAGYVDWRPFYLDLASVAPKNRKAAVRKRLLDIHLAYEPGTRVLYSDLGFMLLEWVIETTAGVTLPRFLSETFYDPLSLSTLGFFGSHPQDRFSRDRFAATEDCPWRRQMIQGMVHDENAYALGGYSGHAGLFGTAEAVYALANLLREHWRGDRSDYLRPQTVRTFFTRQDRVDESTWALGWDTPSPVNSSAGKCFSEKSVGHLGFTGTSLWMDLGKDVIIVFLSNRVHPTRKNEMIRTFRPVLHDRIMEAFGLTR
jgi:serine-type D-Ala-D-Ala carboxypeptidase